MKRSLCPFPGCLAITDGGKYCATHNSHQIERDRRAAEAATRRWDTLHAKTDHGWVYRDARWRKARTAHLKEQPDCVRCGQHGTTVDHVIPHRGAVALAFDRANLMTLCGHCHAIKSRLDRSNPYPPSEKKGAKR